MLSTASSELPSPVEHPLSELELLAEAVRGWSRARSSARIAAATLSISPENPLTCIVRVRDRLFSRATASTSDSCDDDEDAADLRRDMRATTGSSSASVIDES